MTERSWEDVHRAIYRPSRRSNTLEDTVARIVQTIRLGVVAPGAALPPERALAELYEVSRDTVREAIRELADAGILEARRGRGGGTFVIDPLPAAAPPGDLRIIDDTFGMRRVLEAGAARAAAQRTLTAGDREALWARFTTLADAPKDEYRRHDSLLHLAIAEASGIASLIPLVAENRALVNEWLDAFPLLPRAIEHSEHQHDAIVRAILAGQAEAAEAAMLDHLDASEALVRGFVS